LESNALQANLETCRARFSNLAKARENHELLQVEIENLETKIQSITEMAINRSNAEAITGEVEQITQGLVRTEAVAFYLIVSAIALILNTSYLQWRR